MPTAALHTAGARRPRVLRVAAACIALAVAALASTGAAADRADQRSRFLAAEQALEAKDRSAFQRHLAALEDYPLYPYLVFADLRSRLRQAAPEEVKEFLETYPEIPLSAQLQRAWLAELARQKRWRTYLEFYQPDGSLERQCWQRQALLDTGKRDQALDDIDTLWLHGFSLPDACDVVLEVWDTAGGVTPELAWRRIVLAMQGGHPRLARYLREYLPEDQHHWVLTWYELYHRPERLESVRLEPDRERTREIVAHTLVRLARRDPERAARLEPTIASRYGLTPQQRAIVVRRIGLSLAFAGNPAAAAWLERVSDERTDEYVQAWRIRSALGQQDWAGVLQALERLPAAQQQEDRWRYWRARALESLGHRDRARVLYGEVAQSRSFEGFLAADRLQIPYALQERPLVPDAEALGRLAATAPLQRTRELLALERMLEARREWYAATRAMDEVDLRLAARLAYEWGWHDRAILALAQAGYWDDLDLRFPLAHQDTVVAQARQAGIEPAWAFAVIRRESAFDQRARSPRGAMGLMQLMPRTARHVAKQLRQRPRRTAELYHAETNILFGTAYLRMIMDRFNAHPVLATAAYNAGPYRVSTWLPQRKAVPADIWIETVPFRETRDYVRNVLAYTAIYEQRLGRKGEPLSRRMPPIPPRDSPAVEQRAAGDTSPG